MLNLFTINFDKETKEEKIVELYEEYINLIYYIVSGFFNSQQDIEDVVYEILQKLIVNINSIDIVKSKRTKAFVSTVSTNTCITIKNKKNKEKEVYIEDIGEISISSDSIQDEIDNNEMFLSYKKALLSLPKHYYEIIYLRFYENLPLNKIAKILSLSSDVVYQRFHRAKKMLAKSIEKELENE